MRRAGLWPVVDGLHLYRIHGDADVGDDVVVVDDRGDTKCAFGQLDEEVVVA
jgi:hypothetical protein